jgi:hypothetical protein
MQSLLNADSARWLHQATVARVEQEGHILAHRDEYERLRRRERAAQARPRGRRLPLLQGLRRLRLA